MGRLERSCVQATGDWMRFAPSMPGIERVEARFAGHGFAPHRHDSYAVGYTLEGVQAFRYRGASRHCVAGRSFVLHPDELHDGHAGSEQGFRYRIAYVAPHLIGEALTGRGGVLPFVPGPVTADPQLAAAIAPALDDLDGPLEELQRDQFVLELAEALVAADGSIVWQTVRHVDRVAVRRARELLDESVARPLTSAELEANTGLDRFRLARHFRACLGTSPHRYLVMRRLDRARDLIDRGEPLAAAAAASGFADQSHMTRHFRRAYGLTPGHWLSLIAPIVAA